MLVLNAHDVESCIDMGGAIAASREALAMLAQAQADVPVRHHIGVGADADDPSVSLYMPGYIPGAACPPPRARSCWSIPTPVWSRR